MENQQLPRRKVFISYSHTDSNWLERLHVHLKPLVRDFDVEIWDDTKIKPGSKWKEEIKNAINQAKVAILLISADFLASDFIANDELPPLLKAAEESGAIILPLVISPSRFLSSQGVSQFQSVNPPSRPLISLTKGEQEEVFVRMSEFIEESLVASPATDLPIVDSAEVGEQMVPPTKTRQTLDDKPPGLERYDVLHLIYQGHYSKVLKCRSLDTTRTCIVKMTAKDQVSPIALRTLQKSSCRNIAIPRRLWEADGNVYEELPYVGGVRLSNAVLRNVGGLSGSVLESFHDQVVGILRDLHTTKIIHRDIHPDNIYMVIRRKNTSNTVNGSPESENWEYDSFGLGDASFQVAWVLVDCTFATLMSEAHKYRYRHGPFTPEDQEIGEATPASDMYAFGATLYFGITGSEIPSFQRRKREPTLLSSFPSGDHPSVQFSDYLKRLLSLDPLERPPSNYYLQLDTTTSGFSGALRVSDSTILIADSFATESRLVTTSEALEIFQAKYNRWGDSESSSWIKELREPH